MLSNTMLLNQEFIGSANLRSSSILIRLAEMLSFSRIESSFQIFAEQEKCPRLSSFLHYEVVHLPGRLDVSNSARIRRTILRLIDQQCSLLIDFSDLREIDSSGLAILVESFARAKAAGLEQLIVGANGASLRMLQLNHLDKVFPLFERIEHVTG